MQHSSKIQPDDSAFKNKIIDCWENEKRKGIAEACSLGNRRRPKYGRSTSADEDLVRMIGHLHMRKKTMGIETEIMAAEKRK